MNEDPDFLVNVWLAMKPYIQKKEAYEAALSFIKTAEEFCDIESIGEGMLGHDASLDQALNEIYSYNKPDDDAEDDDLLESDNFDSDYEDDEE